MQTEVPISLVMLLLVGGSLSAETVAESQRVEANRVAEVALVSDTAYEQPFVELELTAIVAQPDGRDLRVPAFWAGGNRWCFRYASPVSGRHTWKTECSDHGNPKLHGVTGTIAVFPYRGENPLFLHEPIRVAEDKRHFEHVDGTPFFWLGDTWWKGLCNRIPWEGFQTLTDDRKAKGYTVVQTIGGGPYPDEPLFDPRWGNEGGMPYEIDLASINPAYLAQADRRIAHLIDAGIMPAIVDTWSFHNPGRVSNLTLGKDSILRHWCYLIARYGAYPVSWIVAGEMIEPE